MSYYNEHFWESRRVWGAGLTLLAVIASAMFPQHVPDVIIPLFGVAASLLGLHSWRFPKEENK